MMPVCLPDEADWKTTSNKYWGEYTTVTGYGRVDQFVQLFQGRDQRSCRLLKDYLQVKPSYDKACKRVRFISKPLLTWPSLRSHVLVVGSQERRRRRR